MSIIVPIRSTSKFEPLKYMISPEQFKSYSVNQRTPRVKIIMAIARPHLISKTFSFPLFLLVLLLSVVPVAVAQGGKAEPLRVQFKLGTTSAKLTGTVRGTEQFEYVVAARAGQWMFVEVTSAPADSAIFLVNDPAGEEGAYHYYWSGTLKQTGDYLISVSKPPAYADRKSVV